jgi:hypothetical protein
MIFPGLRILLGSKASFIVTMKLPALKDERRTHLTQGVM